MIISVYHFLFHIQIAVICNCGNTDSNKNNLVIIVCGGE